MATTPAKRACPECGTLLPEEAEFCPVCALREAIETPSESVLDTSSELRFEHYQVLKNKDGTPVELGRGAMGITYKALDVPLQCPVALKIVNARFIGDDSARRGGVAHSVLRREDRSAPSVPAPTPERSCTPSVGSAGQWSVRRCHRSANVAPAETCRSLDTAE